MSEIIRGNKDPRFIEYMSYEEDQRKRLNTMLRKSKEEGEEIGRILGIEEGRNIGIAEGRKLGMKEGRTLGMKEGRKLGMKEGRTLGMKEGRTLGMKEGYKNANKENAYKMREEGIPISVIQRVTGINLIS